VLNISLAAFVSGHYFNIKLVLVANYRAWKSAGCGGLRRYSATVHSRSEQ